jgi:formylglycine-generating enzyme required for sulfatase activity
LLGHPPPPSTPSATVIDRPLTGSGREEAQRLGGQQPHGRFGRAARGQAKCTMPSGMSHVGDRPCLGYVGLAVSGVLGVAVWVSGSTWSAIPDAVNELRSRPGSQAAEQVLHDAEASVLAEAVAGRLGAVIALMDAYEQLLTPLADGEGRCDSLRSRAADALASFGDSRVSDDPEVALRSWALAASYVPSAQVLSRLRSSLLPPRDGEPGSVWRSPIDGADLVFHPSMKFQLGCTPGDNACQKDEAGRPLRTEPFWLERTEVTNRRYRGCVEARACPVPVESDAFGDPRRADDPVVGVTYRHAAAYAAWAGRRLPSEAEWERASRGTDDGARYPWGKGRDRGLANVQGTADGDLFEGLAPVASFPATGLGVFDIAGNVWEWCADTFHLDQSQGPRDGRAWISSGWGRVARGGSWRRTVDVCRVSSRTWHEEDYFADDVGFRTAVDVPERMSDLDLGRLVQQAFPMPEITDRSLQEAHLTDTDRRYLERRALTWLVLEGRIAEAVPRVLEVLRKDPEDPVAVDLLAHLEREMAADIQRGDVVAIHQALLSYRSAVGDDGGLRRRLADHELRLLEQIRVNIEQVIERGDRASYSASVEFVRLLNPGDPVLQTLMESSRIAPGTIRVGRRDRKEMVWIPSGTYRMGASPDDGQAGYDEHPPRTVKVEGFWLDRTEVTNDEYRLCVNAGVCSPPHRTAAFDDPRTGRDPVLWVDWYQARTYARWAGKRLPTEAEWEWAVRAGQTTRYSWGDEWQDGRANAFGVLGSDRWDSAAPAASFEPNAWGVYDMLGNAAEWLQDAYHRNYWDAPSDARAWMQFTGEQVERKRVVRGGSFNSPSSRLRVSYRDQRAEDSFSRSTGFRCALER